MFSVLNLERMIEATSWRNFSKIGIPDKQDKRSWKMSWVEIRMNQVDWYRKLIDEESWFCKKLIDEENCLTKKVNSLTHEWLEVKTANFGQVDHLWPHKAGDCDYL